MRRDGHLCQHVRDLTPALIQGVDSLYVGHLVQVDGIDSAGPGQRHCSSAHAFEKSDGQRILEQLVTGTACIVDREYEGQALEKKP